MVGLLAFVFVFFLLVLVHELGHFVVAKLCGLRVERFQIGFGKALLPLGRWGETYFSVGPVPLGGFVKIYGMEPGEYPPEERAFYNAALWKRFLTILAGPAMSLALGYFLFVTTWSTYGISEPVNDPIIGYVENGKIAAKAGIRSGDRVVSLNGVPVTEWGQVSNVIHESAGKPLHMVLSRDGRDFSTTVIPESAEVPDLTHPLQPRMETIGRIFCIPKMVRHRLGFAEAIETATFNFNRNVQALIGTIFSKLVTKSLGGPVQIAKATSDASDRGMADTLELAGQLSLSLGVINLLPLPVLDGGYLMMYTIEFLRRGKRLSERMQLGLQYAGTIFLILLFLVITTMDISRIVSGK